MRLFCVSSHRLFVTGCVIVLQASRLPSVPWNSFPALPSSRSWTAAVTSYSEFKMDQVSAVWTFTPSCVAF